MNPSHDARPAQLPPSFYVAVAQFNRGEYYRCHETLEAIWIPEKRVVRELYQGVLQIAVGCYHLTRANRNGAINLLERGARRLERALRAVTPVVPDSASLYEIDWPSLIAAADHLQARLRLRDHGVGTDDDRSLLPVIRRS